MLTRKKVRTSVLLVMGILLLANLIASRFFFRLDYTADQRDTLSNATKDILNQLSEPVTISAYFSQDLPPNVEQVGQDFRGMLVEYSSNSDGLIVYEFINPSENQESEMKAQQGRGAVLALYKSFTRIYNDDHTPHTLHMTTNVLVDVEPGGERASAESCAVVFQALEDFPLQPIIGVRYSDTFTRESAGWRSEQRRIATRLSGNLSRHLLRQPV